MYLIYVDESGYQENWSEDTSIYEQPVHVLCAVAIHSQYLDSTYQTMRNETDKLALKGIVSRSLGNGTEIKARDVDRGTGFWQDNPDKRQRIREIYLGQSNVTYFAVLIDKAAHRNKYAIPEDPSKLALKYLFERLQGFLQEKQMAGIILIDANKRIELRQREDISRLVAEGSWGSGISRLYGTLYEWSIKFHNIVEVHFSDSRYSLGLQIADFVARHTYSWWKENKNNNYPGWGCIESKLWKHPDYNGWGYKEFP